MVKVWIIVLFNVFHQWQGTLPDKYPTENDCKLALMEKHLADINVFGPHGECTEVAGTKVTLPKTK